MPSRAAPPTRLRREDPSTELIGYRAVESPMSIAICPPHKLLAAATAAPGGGGGNSRIDLVRLWREEGDQELRRPLKAVASIRDCGGVVHRLAWSRGGAGSKYRLGLLAGGLDGGAVSIWDPSRLLFEPNFDKTKEELHDGRRVSWSDNDGNYSACSLHVVMYDLDGKPKSLAVVEEAPKIKLQDIVLEAAVSMRLNMDSLIEDYASKERHGKVDAQPECDWLFIEKEDTVGKVLGRRVEAIGDGLVLKLKVLNGPVLGLTFNYHYTYMLACAAYGERLKIYYLDHSDEFAARGRSNLDVQITFLEWHPIYSAVLASTCDYGSTKIWDLREQSSKCTYMMESDKGLSCIEVHWNPCDPVLFAVASKDNYNSPIKIWDVRNNQKALYKFGNGKGVSSLSWSSSGLITSTDIDGVIDCWKLDGNQNPVSWSSSASGFQEARWCQSGATLAAVSSHSLEVYKMPADRCIWPRKA